ncbi:MAG: acetyl/propionyl/methylcrotonyl-CoA carboxylase subunit alpha [Brevibacterium aurantiacum]|uniref:biotin carboxylase n=1 Tax=Brevibacterium aurantiacum TaxID=273384 RepID=A0A1D7W2Q7_BREAU|nr:biotin carboxylase N-terminal domain-containing protein [Brevibacterium aurantiacum]MDN5592618.1 ATP-grasp domain-containing protein [Brevibacterium sp.]AOP53250.1 Biotin carboxylase of acetyl-CoA carboxylase [Brevibacterium aurantiacum]AZL05482.1 ATP-grasp domain-containing protein [Brevibacterium aurantiacum]AZL09068.1 ATP-grasp domain-containing protein [Brevibacterium aurantiacum]AZL12678.1 ATP-grasp domain-containing protein [Brevibacterium aurantiacum]
MTTVLPEPSTAQLHTDVPTAAVRRVLIANRGEIALRIIRAAHDLGVKAIAVYTRADSDADFVHLADDAWLLDGAGPGETYLDIEKILALAKRSGADAIHPGYGYLAENAMFAQAVIDAGLTWIGPPPAAIELLGDKSGAREVAEAVSAPVAPGSDGAVADLEEAAEVAQRIGYPIVIKAVHGGGGRGFRACATAADLETAYTAATREALSAFGRGECLIEKQIVRPRHIETQCLADAHGNVQVLSTRDCTLQRRNQKIVEEAPAPFLGSDQERLVTEASIRVLAHVGYVGAATCEFLLGTDGTIIFMEANARIQVEHTVTEEVTGVDLVAWQLRIASGEHLPESFPQVRGHSIQFRINAEDPTTYFPATGTVKNHRAPAGPGVRLDSGIGEGSVVGTDFDPMLAKLIITGADRNQALARARRALDEYRIEGVSTLLPLHRVLVSDKAFAQDFEVWTNWLETAFVNPLADPQLGEQMSTATDSFSVVVEVDGRRMTVSVPKDVISDLGHVPSPSVPRRKRSLSRKGAQLADDSNSLNAPMQGTIVSVSVAAGDTVEAGDTLAVIEAMKMEQPLKAGHSGTVSEVLVDTGVAVRSGEPIIRFAA